MGIERISFSSKLSPERGSGRYKDCDAPQRRPLVERDHAGDRTHQRNGAESLL